MLVLFILLGVLMVGIIRYIANQLWEQRTDLTDNSSLATHYRQRRSCITSELDELLRFYQQGLLTEEQYFNCTDKLVDELATLLDKEPALQD